MDMGGYVSWRELTLFYKSIKTNWIHEEGTFPRLQTVSKRWNSQMYDGIDLLPSLITRVSSMLELLQLGCRLLRSPTL